MIYKIVLIGIVSTILVVSIKKDAPVISTLLTIAASVLIFLLVLPWLSTVVELLEDMPVMSSFNVPYVETVMKIIGISYICEFGSQICIDAGESSIASKIDLAGKIVIMGISTPIILTLMNQIGSLGL